MDCAHGGQSAKVGGLALGLADWLSVAAIREQSPPAWKHGRHTYFLFALSRIFLS
jgi:hypothetical protein